MEFIINNWYIIFAAVAVLIGAAFAIYSFFKLPRAEQLTKVREWLLWAVTNAEKELGGGTGKLKLRQVYDLFVTRFPWLAKVVPFAVFSALVDDALEEMNGLLAANPAVRALVIGDVEDQTKEDA